MCSSARALPPSFTASKVSTTLAGRMPFQTRSLMPTRGVWVLRYKSNRRPHPGTTALHAKWGLQVHTSRLFPSTSLFFHLVQHSSLLNNQEAATTCHTALMSTLALLKKPSALQRRTGNRRTAGEVLSNSVCPPGCGSLAGWLHRPDVEPPAGAQCCARPGAGGDSARSGSGRQPARAVPACQPPTAHGVGPRGLLPLQPAVLQTPLLAGRAESTAPPMWGGQPASALQPAQAEGVRAYLRHKQGAQARVGGSSLVLFRAAAPCLTSARSPTAVCISSKALFTARRPEIDRPMPSCAAARLRRPCCW